MLKINYHINEYFVKFPAKINLKREVITNQDDKLYYEEI